MGQLAAELLRRVVARIIHHERAFSFLQDVPFAGFYLGGLDACDGGCAPSVVLESGNQHAFIG